MAKPVGEENWLAYLEETVRTANDLESRVNAIESYKHAVNEEPGSLRIWLSYCNYFWWLWESTQAHASNGWTEEEQLMGRELFSFGSALDLWQQGYGAIRYRLNDSHLLWDRWVSLEMEQLAKSRTPEGIKRITHLYTDRLTTPHMTWEETSQRYSSFLTEYNRAAWESAMGDITAIAQPAKKLIAARDPFELRLKQLADSSDIEAHKEAMTAYLEWEMGQSKRSIDSLEMGLELCRGLFARALTGVLATDQATWYEYVVLLSSSNSFLQTPTNLLDILRRAVHHCPWSGLLWNRYIQCAEETKLPFGEVESIKHAATSEDQLLKDGMEGMIEMYVAWCGFLKRTAMDATATDESVDVADMGLSAALEDVTIVGQRLYGQEYQGDPKFRLERIYIQYLTEKKGAIDKARSQWNKLASIELHADNHDFWFRYYMWEMLIFSSNMTESLGLMAPPSGPSFRVPSFATGVLRRAVQRKTIDWPEKVLEVYMQHCNDYEPPLSLRRAADQVHRTTKAVQKRRARENEEKAAAYGYFGAQPTEEAPLEEDSPNSTKRKRTSIPAIDWEPGTAPKRHKADAVEPEPLITPPTEGPKRDRENSTIIVTNLPGDVTQTKVRQYFKEYGHINNITAFVQDNGGETSTALIEFKSPEEAQSALLRDGKYFSQSLISVQSGHDLTVFAANYPPSAGEKYVRNLFKDCGDILSIRWPSLQKNSHRRFCYISFRDRDSSAKAVQKDGTVLDDRYKLMAKYSDPGHKKTREGAVAESREVYVGNLDRGVSESEVRDAFSKYGTVTRVNIPQSTSGRAKGFAFIDFATKEEAEKAVSELNNVKFHSQILKVEVSKEKKFKPTARTTVSQRDSASPAPSSKRDNEGDEMMEDTSKPTGADIASRTVALMGLPDTVSNAWVRALVEPVGAVTGIILQPAHGGAKIEFVDAATAGKAVLKLEGMEYEGHKLRTGTVDELRRSKVERQEDRIVYGSKNQKPKPKPKNEPKDSSASKGFMPPPTTIRRPALGKVGPKRKLGFARPAAPPSSKPGAETNGEPVKKSNADFKAMFLTSGDEGEKQENKAGEAEGDGKKQGEGGEK
ncbi:hypothetical protein B0T10DRAFT_618 [Thelonectria olida]|uniref:RRM domain-containing protein n=1 Tax=Thelonectria olida TaxID=1576542 RepID=A0A9P9AT91_9HYPO|nr:hypothetical protein B0T10DRAFT_618 [Thelonectria olida]